MRIFGIEIGRREIENALERAGETVITESLRIMGGILFLSYSSVCMYTFYEVVYEKNPDINPFLTATLPLLPCAIYYVMGDNAQPNNDDVMLDV